MTMRWGRKRFANAMAREKVSLAQVASATAANRHPLERNQGQDVQTNSSIHRRGHLLSPKPCLLNDASTVQTNESQRVRGLDFGQNEEEFPNRSAAAIAV
ncbi:hypothetical protein ElyMa_000206100 [Elysia marginata]|uniref:Uncharacterized protein n=1 Tax=Elysia marginata TaxID=1093978 RepID=A0AAV4EWX9_9GAST|nr:hypothetical protein ElyMa_000206100 [Elysia marginata]